MGRGRNRKKSKNNNNQWNGNRNGNQNGNQNGNDGNHNGNHNGNQNQANDNGNQNASSTLVREIVPQGSIYNEADSTPTVWSCSDGSPGGTDCLFAPGALDALDGGTLTFAVTVTDIPSDRIILNEVAIDLDAAGVDGLDPNLGDNLDFARTPFPALSINTVTRPVLVLSIFMLLFAGMQQARRSARKR